MRSLCLSILVLILLSGCIRRQEIIYMFKEDKDVFEVETTDPDTVIKKAITFSTIEMNTSIQDSIWIHFIYSEPTPNVKKLRSIKTTLSEIEEQGRYTALPSSCDLTIEYYNGKKQVKISRKDNPTALNTLIDWKDVNYTYEFLQKEYVKENNDITYTYSYNFLPESGSYPDTLRLAVELNWENGSRTYETFLWKKEYTGPKFNPKF